jgi:hypothetical protein
MTRTALYVSQPTILEISPNDSTDKTADIERYPTRASAGKANGSVALEPGIYLIRSVAYVGVTGKFFQAEVSINNKDEWPDPPHTLIAETAPGATGESLREFFRISKSADGPTS